MRRCIAIALSALWLGGAVAGVASAQQARLLSQIVWKSDAPGFGGVSGLEVSDGGKSLLAITDKGHMIRARLQRDKLGMLTGAGAPKLSPLRGPKGEILQGLARDAEGLVLREDGRIYISYEGVHRVLAYLPGQSRAAWIEQHPDFAKLQPNAGLEALAVDQHNRLYALPERRGFVSKSFPVYRYEGAGWRVFGHVSRSDDFLPVGADFGPDQRLYLLERRFSGLGFRSRVRSFAVGEKGFLDERLHLLTARAAHGNLEGISVWQDESKRTRLTMVADNNFLPLLTTHLVEYVLLPLK